MSFEHRVASAPGTPGSHYRWHEYPDPYVYSDAGGKLDAFEFETDQEAAGLPQSLANLRALSAPSTPPTLSNALRVVKAVSQYHCIPWRIAYTILEHEGGMRLFRHHDGVMQTTKGARNTILPRISRPMKLALLCLDPFDSSPDAMLISLLHKEFHRRVAVQIAAGVQELKDNLDRFNGYVALAFVAYNAGAGWAYYIATRGKSKSRPQALTGVQWENIARFGSSLLHQSPIEAEVATGVWQCDANIPAWFKVVRARDRQSRLPLIAYQYLRSVNVCIRSGKPLLPCDWTTHRRRHVGSGPVICRPTRAGALDKLYNPARLRAAYYDAAKRELFLVAEDNRPLKVLNGRLVKTPAISSVQVGGVAVPA